jgi:transposase
MTLVAEIGDIARFPTAGKLCPWAGLTPGAQLRPHPPPWPSHQAGLALGAGILQEAAQTAKRHPMFAGASAQLARRRGNNIATTAIARRLLARSFHILTQLEAQNTSDKAPTGRARVSACASNTAARPD